MLTYQERQTICAAIEAKRELLVDAVLQDFNRNPFWEDRYGERGRQLARQDNHYHLDFLTAAIRTDSPGSLGDYYKWLQILLVSRGMCSYHIRQNLDYMARHLSALLPQEWHEIEFYHRAGAAGLEYARLPCRALSGQESKIAEATTVRMFTSNPFWLEQFGDGGRMLCLQDNLFHLSYLQDAVGTSAPQLFAKYLEWLTGFLGKRGITVEHLHDDLRILEQEISRQLTVSEVEPFIEILEGVQ